MPDAKSAGERLAARFEKMLEKVRSLERGGDLESLLYEESAEIRRLIEAEAVAERAAMDVSPEADSPPSGVSEVRGDDG